LIDGHIAVQVSHEAAAFCMHVHSRPCCSQQCGTAVLSGSNAHRLQQLPSHNPAA
jgi:hypothetical protein